MLGVGGRRKCAHLSCIGRILVCYLARVIAAFVVVPVTLATAQSLIVVQPGEINPGAADVLLAKRVAIKVHSLGVALRAGSFSPDPKRSSNPADGRPSELIPVDLFQDLLQLEASVRRSGLDVSFVGTPWVTIAGAIATTGAVEDADRVFARAFTVLGTNAADNVMPKVYAMISYAYFLLNNGRLDDAEALLEDAGQLLPKMAEHKSATVQQMLRGQQELAKGALFSALAQTSLGRRNWKDAVTYARWGMAFKAGDLMGSAQLNIVLALGLAADKETLPEAEMVIRESVNSLDEIFKAFNGMKLDEFLCPCDTSRLILAEILARQGKWSEASKEAERALERLPEKLKATGYWRAIGLPILARAKRHQGDSTGALNVSRLAAQAYMALDHSDAWMNSYRILDPRIISEQALLSVAPLARATDDETLALVQLPQRSGISGAISKLAERYAYGDTDAALLVREQQDLLSYRRAFGLERSKLVGANAAEAARDMDAKFQAATDRLMVIEKEISAKAPRYAALISTQPASLKQLHQHLREDEAIVTWFIGNEGAWAIAIRKGASYIVPIDARNSSLREQSKLFRNMVELRSESRLGVFPAQQAHELYQKLFGAIAAKLEGVTHTFIVPDATILDLPMTALVAKKPEKSFINPEDTDSFRRTSWLIDQYAITVLPSISSLPVLRSLEQQETSQDGFFGVGDPLLNAPDKPLETLDNPTRSAQFALARVALLQPLPESATELKTIGKLLSKDGGTILLGAKATEKAVKQSKLDQYKVVSFATHGIVAGELPGVREPGLVLTTPKSPSEEDDGILTASEISRLKFRAEWVILSACNTAAGNSVSNNAPLEGLARSFVFAGAKSLLVSHWAVDSLSAVELTTRTVQSATQIRAPFAIAHQKAMQAMIRSDNPSFAHPSAWAAFFVVGVSGAPH